MLLLSQRSIPSLQVNDLRIIIITGFIQDKCHLFLLGNKFEHLWVKISNNRVCETRTVKTISIIIDYELKFEEHLSKFAFLTESK